jgi:hypothetical protein
MSGFLCSFFGVLFPIMVMFFLYSFLQLSLSRWHDISLHDDDASWSTFLDGQLIQRKRDVEGGWLFTKT